MISKTHLQRNKTICAIFEGGPKKRGALGNCLNRVTQYPSLRSGVKAVNALVYLKTKNSEIGSTYLNLLN